MGGPCPIRGLPERHGGGQDAQGGGDGPPLDSLWPASPECGTSLSPIDTPSSCSISPAASPPGTSSSVNSGLPGGSRIPRVPGPRAPLGCRGEGPRVSRPEDGCDPVSSCACPGHLCGSQYFHKNSFQKFMGLSDTFISAAPDEIGRAFFMFLSNSSGAACITPARPNVLIREFVLCVIGTGRGGCPS